MKRQDFCVHKASKRHPPCFCHLSLDLPWCSFTYSSMLRSLGSVKTSQLHPAGHLGCTPNPSLPCTHAQAPCWEWRPQGSCWEEQERRCLGICPGEALAWQKARPHLHQGSKLLVHTSLSHQTSLLRAQIQRLKCEEFQDGNCKALNSERLHWSHIREAGPRNRGWSKPGHMD